jgi:hypothetical protein
MVRVSVPLWALVSESFSVVVSVAVRLSPPEVSVS